MSRTLQAAAVTAAILAGNAFAQDTQSTISAEANPSLKRMSVEIRPIDSLISATPGVASGGATIESYLGKNFAVNVGGTYMDVNLPTKISSTVTDKTNEPVVDNGYGYAVGGGVRYYDMPIGDSVYGGLNVDYSESNVGWTYNDEAYKSRMYAVTPSLVAGYRWVWANGLLLRLGAGAGLPSVASSKVAALTDGERSAEGKEKVEDLLDQQVVAKADLGVGMMF